MLMRSRYWMSSRISGSTWRKLSGSWGGAPDSGGRSGTRGRRVQGGRAGIVDDCGAELLGQGEHAQDAADARLCPWRMDGFAERADVRAGVAGARQ